MPSASPLVVFPIPLELTVSPRLRSDSHLRSSLADNAVMTYLASDTLSVNLSVSVSSGKHIV